VTPSDQRSGYHPGDDFSPAAPREELREVARGQRARTPVTLIGGGELLIKSVEGEHAMWLA
jgi:hypothetical protein